VFDGDSEHEADVDESGEGDVEDVKTSFSLLFSLELLTLLLLLLFLVNTLKFCPKVLIVCLMMTSENFVFDFGFVVSASVKSLLFESIERNSDLLLFLEVFCGCLVNVGSSEGGTFCCWFFVLELL
jgi:hypothetical protein